MGRGVEALGLLGSDLLITTARGVHAGPLAEFAFLILFAHVRKLGHLADLQRRHLWERFCGEELEGRTLAIAGMGEVGRRLASGGHFFGMRVVALASPGSRRSAGELGVDALYPNDDLHAMLSEADALVLSVPHTPETDKFIDAAALRALKPGAVLVNIARGGVVDEPALLEAPARRTHRPRGLRRVCGRAAGGRQPFLGHAQRDRQPPLFGQRSEREPQDHRHLPLQPALLPGRALRRHA